jgi:transposase
MPKNRSLLTDEQWKHIRPFIPEREYTPKGGRPPADDRKCFEGILWVLRMALDGVTSQMNSPRQVPVGGA